MGTHSDVAILSHRHQFSLIQQNLHNVALVTRLATFASNLNLEKKHFTNI
jgi:hypothetical protein